MNSFERERQLEKTMIDRIQRRRDKLETLHSDYRGYVNYIGDMLPTVCRACLGDWGKDKVLIMRGSTKCQLNCKFCYYRGTKKEFLPSGLVQMRGRNYPSADMDMMLDLFAPVAIRWLHYEPLLELGTMLEFMPKIKERGLYQSMNTNGLKANKSTLATLIAAGLDDIRFNLAATNCAQHVMENALIAKDMGLSVGVETPMYPEFYKVFIKNKDLILKIFDYFCFQELQVTHASVKDYGAVYRYRGGHVCAISSSACIYDIMDMAEKEDWGKVVLDCGCSTKYYRNVGSGDVWISRFQELPR